MNGKKSMDLLKKFELYCFIQLDSFVMAYG